jgi:hypothetical protein
MRKLSGKTRISIAGDDGIQSGHHDGQRPNHACSSGAAPSAEMSVNRTGE